MSKFSFNHFLKIALLSTSVLLLGACQKDEVNNNMATKRIDVAPQLVDCVGVAPMKCMKVKEQGQDWQLFYSHIEGFIFEPGYNYQLEVKVTKKQQPIPADASSLQWTLVKVISKEKATNQ